MPSSDRPTSQRIIEQDCKTDTANRKIKDETGRRKENRRAQQEEKQHGEVVVCRAGKSTRISAHLLIHTGGS